jgi:hypothetical protein
LELVKKHYELNPALAGYDGPAMQAVKGNSFRGSQICEFRLYYFDATSMVEAARAKG